MSACAATATGSMIPPLHGQNNNMAQLLAWNGQGSCMCAGANRALCRPLADLPAVLQLQAARGAARPTRTIRTLRSTTRTTAQSPSARACHRHAHNVQPRRLPDSRPLLAASPGASRASLICCPLSTDSPGWTAPAQRAAKMAPRQQTIAGSLARCVTCSPPSEL